MKKLKKLVLVLCAIFPIAFCFANGVVGTGNMEEETTIVLKKKHTQNNGSDKNELSITASISGHMLLMSFSQNIGSVFVEISDGQSFTVVTPDNAQAYITNSGSYTVNFTLANGDEYYGHFVVN